MEKINTTNLQRVTHYALLATNPPVSQIMEECVGMIVAECKDDLEALVLVGSFSRGEGIAVQENERVNFLSDIEFWAVSKERQYRVMRAKVKGLSRAIEKYLEAKNIDVEITIGATTRKHLRRLKPYVFTLEAKGFGKVLCGNEEILRLIPRYSEQQIDPFDGFILLNNRIAEQLIVLGKILTRESSIERSPERSEGNRESGFDRHAIDKGYIQIVNSLLTFKGRYKSLYIEKVAEIKDLLPKLTYLESKIPGLIAETEEALNRLGAGKQRVISKEEALKEWHKLKNYFKEVWFYEARSLFSNRAYSLEKLIRKFVSISSLSARIKGWAKLFLPPKKELFLNLGQGAAAFFLTSPRFLIYQQAVTHYFSDEPDMGRVSNIVKAWEAYVK